MKLYRGYKKRPKFASPKLVQEWEELSRLKESCIAETKDIIKVINKMGADKFTRWAELSPIVGPQFFTDQEVVAREFAGGKGFVVAFEVLEHLKDPKNALINIKKMLTKNGTLIFSTPFPTKRSLGDPTHINVHEEKWWLKVGKMAGYKDCKMVHATFVPFFYKYSSMFSFGLPVKTNIPYINSTVFFIFK